MAWERSGVPGGATRTSWSDRDLPAMWRLLENQQSDDHWRLVAGWRKASELTATHLRRLEQYRANLAEVWPPDRNAAAAAYVARLDFLIQNVRTTHDVTAANYTTLAATVGALAAARHDLKPLYDEYVATSRAIKDYADLATFNAAAEAPTVIGKAAVGAQDLERLNNRARAIMYTLSHTLIEAEAAIRQPPTYPSRGLTSPVDPDVYDGRPATTTGNASLHETNSSGSGQPNAGSEDHGVLRSGSLDALNRSMPSSVTPAIPVDDPGHWSATLPVRTPEASVGHPPKGSNGVAARPDGGREGRRVLPVGGVIDSASSARQPGRTQRIVKVSPAGGVIDNPRATAAGGNGASQPTYGAFSAAPREQQGRRIARQGTDTTWPLPEGVPPIITPPKRTGDFDPGPTIGIDL